MLSKFLIAFAVGVCLATAAHAQSPFYAPEGTPGRQQQMVTHNGSLMQVTPYNASQIEISYVDPRPSLWGVGVRPGSVLLRGQWLGSQLSATAYIYTHRCGPIPYSVIGSVNTAGVLTLSGPAPVIDPYLCVVHGLTWNSDNSTLVFAPA
jgi:hypothetical protein